MEKKKNSSAMQIISESVEVTATQTELKKVTDTVGTFWNENSDGFQVPAIKVESGKVTDTVGTFWKEDSDGFQVPAIKADRKR